VAAARVSLAAVPPITPHIVVPDADEAAAWYARALGFEEDSRLTLPDGKVLTVELKRGDAVVSVASEFPDFGIVAPHTIGGTATVLQLEVQEVDELWERALAAGAEVRHPLADAFWGERHGQLVDPFGHRWNLARHDRDVPLEEQERLAAEAFGYG
jgi:PhnB protein